MQLNIFMRIFALERIITVKGKEPFDKLIVDGVSLIDDFEDNLEEQYESEMDAIHAYMDKVSNQESLPYNKFHPLNPGQKGTKEYEFKTKHLRVYGIQQPGGKIIIMGGYKNEQKKDIVQFRSIKNEYLDSISKANKQKVKPIKSEKK